MSGNRNAADEEQLKEQKDQEKIRSRRERLNWKWLLDSETGRRIAWDLLSECGIFETSFTGHSNTTFFNEGRRQIGLSVVKKIKEARPAALTEMMEQSKLREES